jgi:polar amino acid transport system substrate-binding protein
MPARRSLLSVVLAAGAAVAVAAAGACVQADVPESLPGPTTSTTEEAAPPEPEPDCGNPVASLRPTGPATTAVPSDSYMAEIRARGQLRVGVDVATLRLSSIDPLTGDFEGFDVDIAREVAAALLGDPDAVAFVGIPSSERVSVLVDEPVDGPVAEQVDLVASAFTPTCTRRVDIEFSTNYYTSTQDVLLRDDDPAASVADLAGRRICASAGTTTLANIAELPDPAPVPVPAAERADCLVRLQQGEVDGMSTNDTILAGFLAQDPNLRILDADLSTEPTALGLPQGHPEWVRYVNAVLDEVRTSGRWDQLYDQWLADLLGPSPGPPAPTYLD